MAKARIPDTALSGSNPGQVVHTRASVDKHDVVSAYGLWYSAAGEVTAGLEEDGKVTASVTWELTAQDRHQLRKRTLISRTGGRPLH